MLDRIQWNNTAAHSAMLDRIQWNNRNKKDELCIEAWIPGLHSAPSLGQDDQAFADFLESNKIHDAL